MYMLRQRIMNVGSLSGTPTFRYKLPSSGLYTAFQLVIDANRYATRADIAVVYPLEGEVTKIELVEGGSHALLSLPATQLDALNYWSFGRPNPRRYRQEAATGNLLHLFLMGGRGLYDTEYGYDLSRLGETYLEYTHSMSTDAAERFDVSDHEISLYGYRWMGSGIPSFKGYLRARQLAAYATSASTALKTINIPIGYPIRRIGIQAKTRGSTLGGTFTKAELKVNNGEYSPVTITSPMHWAMAEVQEYALQNLIGGVDYAVGTGVTEIPRWWSYYQTIGVNGHYTTGDTNWGANMITLPAVIWAGTAGNAEALFTSRGWGFQKCLRIGFDHFADGSDLLQTRNMGALDLELTEAAASKDCAVFVEDVVSY